MAGYVPRIDGHSYGDVGAVRSITADPWRWHGANNSSLRCEGGVVDRAFDIHTVASQHSGSAQIAVAEYEWTVTPMIMLRWLANSAMSSHGNRFMATVFIADRYRDLPGERPIVICVGLAATDSQIYQHSVAIEATPSNAQLHLVSLCASIEIFTVDPLARLVAIQSLERRNKIPKDPHRNAFEFSFLHDDLQDVFHLILQTLIRQLNPRESSISIVMET